METLSDLNSKISAINSITTTKTTQTKSSLGSIKVSAEDASFFAKLVENSNNANTVQTNVTVNTNTNQVNLADAKAQAAQQSSAAVSQALIEKLQDSMNTNKSFRVDFDKDVAVIMRVDSNGVLSANFIPGSSAVEQALRNNLAELRQTFNEKGLEYNELSYSSRQQKHQQKQQRNQKGGRDE
ncbi:flagellar hook-length control protein FliK [bacterium]|nr:flagellar hook-length control protein FliK [bacterium]